MFEHLDDPQGFTPDDTFRSGVLRHGRQRRLRRRLAATSALAVVLVAGLAGAALARVDHQLDRVERLQVGGLPDAEPASKEPYTVLFVGSDNRGSDGLVADGDAVPGKRSDTVILARVHPDDRVTVLPLPRDLWVDIPGHGGGRINAAFSMGGPSLLVDTLRQDFGVPVDRYVEIDFGGARDIADAMGGLRLSFPAPARDLHAGFVADAGCQTLDGPMVLSLARSRHLQFLEDARWTSDPTSDLGRIERQQVILVAALGALSHLDTSSPRQLDDLLSVAAHHLTIDARTSNRELVELFRGIAGSRIDQLRLPVVDAVRGGADVLDQGPGADAVLTAFTADQASTPPATVPGAPDTVLPSNPTPVYLPTPC